MVLCSSTWLTQPPHAQEYRYNGRYRPSNEYCTVMGTSHVEMSKPEYEFAVPTKGRKSFSRMETSTAAEATASLLGMKVMAADMPGFMKVHAFRCMRRAHDRLDKFSARQMAHDIKKEFDDVYGPTWHCIVGTSFGSFVTHSRGCFIYLSLGKVMVMLFKTGVRVKDC